MHVFFTIISYNDSAFHGFLLEELKQPKSSNVVTVLWLFVDGITFRPLRDHKKGKNTFLKNHFFSYS